MQSGRKKTLDFKQCARKQLLNHNLLGIRFGHPWELWHPCGHASQTWPAERSEGTLAHVYKPGHNLHKQNHFSNMALRENHILVLIQVH